MIFDPTTPTVSRNFDGSISSITDLNMEKCYRSNAEYLGLPMDGAAPNVFFQYWFPNLMAGATAAAPTGRQLAVGQHWLACVVYLLVDSTPPSDISLRYGRSLRNAVVTGIGRDQLGICLLAGDWSAGSQLGGCRSPHTTEVFAYGNTRSAIGRSHRVGGQLHPARPPISPPEGRDRRREVARPDQRHRRHGFGAGRRDLAGELVGRLRRRRQWLPTTQRQSAGDRRRPNPLGMTDARDGGLRRARSRRNASVPSAIVVMSLPSSSVVAGRSRTCAAHTPHSRASNWSNASRSAPFRSWPPTDRSSPGATARSVRRSTTTRP